MNVNFEAIEKAWFKPKKTVLDELEEWLGEKIIETDNTRKLHLMYSPSEERLTATFHAYLKVKDKIQELKKEM